MEMRLTLIGLYNYDSTLFNDMVMPNGVDSDLVKNTILQKSGEFELIYPALDYMKMMIKFWSNKHQRTFEKWFDALNIQYDPLYNYDRMEEITIGRKGSDVKGGNTKSNTKGSTTPPATTTTNTDTVAAYDSSTYQPKEQRTDQLTINTSGSDSSDSEGSYNEVNQRNEDETHTAHLYGNIGVTTSQQMLQSELDIARFNLYEQIADLFVEEFCIMIY